MASVPAEKPTVSESHPAACRSGISSTATAANTRPAARCWRACLAAAGGRALTASHAPAISATAGTEIIAIVTTGTIAVYFTSPGVVERPAAAVWKRCSC